MALTIGQVATAADVNIQTMRYYERRGALPSPDTATVRLHISKMTCGSCPATARLALKRLTGVYNATVTLGDSLGVVRYDPQLVKPAQIAAHLTRLTGYGATVLPDTTSGKP